MLRRWRAQNGWTQYTAKSWAAESDVCLIAPSGLSELEQGKTRHPRTKTFLWLAELNNRVAAEDFAGVRSRDLLDRLKDSSPITCEDGRPWGPAEFWSCHAGLIDPPDWVNPDLMAVMPQLGDEEAVELSKKWAEEIKSAILKSGGGKSEAMKVVGNAPARERKKWEDVLLGFDYYRKDDLVRIWDARDGRWLPEVWIEEWMDLVPSE